MRDLTDIYGMLFGQADDQQAPPADLTRDAPPTMPTPSAEMPLPAWMRDPDMQSLLRRGRPQPALMRAERNAYLAGAVTAHPAQAQRVADVPTTTRSVQGTDINGQVTYEDAPRPVGDLYNEVGPLTGVRAGFLRDLAVQESGENPNAQPTTSQALGLMQFTPGTWRQVIARHGAALGFPLELDDAHAQELRRDPRWSMAMGAALASDNARDLQDRIGQRPSEREVYLAHFLGTDSASALIKASRNWRGSLPAVNILPRNAVDANRSIFYEKDGRPRSVNAVINLQGQGFSGRQWADTQGQ